MSRVPEHVRALLVCPSCRGDLEDLPGFLRCPAEKLRYPVVNGVPWLVPEKAEREGSRPR